MNNVRKLDMGVGSKEVREVGGGEKERERN